MPSRRRPAPNRRPPGGAALAVALVGLMAGCGARDATSGQVVARINGDEITVHQVGTPLASQALRPEQVPQAERQILERLIDRQLAVQRALELKLDREPQVVQAVESARQEILARAYSERLAEGAARPSAADVKKYYEAHPALFRERKIYQLQEFTIDADAAHIDALRSALPALRGADVLAAHLRERRLPFRAAASTRAAEQLPLSLLPSLAALDDGQALLEPVPAGALVRLVESSRPQPVDEAGAARAIETLLTQDARRRLIADDRAAMRAAARIEYLGRFGGPSAPRSDEAPQPVAAAGVAAPPAAVAILPLDVGTTRRAALPASAVDVSTVNKGLGLQ